MRLIPSTMSWRQRLGELAGQLFVNIAAALIAGIAILLLVLSAHYQVPQLPPEVAITAGAGQ
ncbi:MULTISPECIES: hypothetical protein [unclassified Mesorhizobium]|uniref:hypothetical protein n=1 Tax=unclassified Mesorhizobium TaxID=325217 RepID=UPI000FC9B72B|nr:MULTISPECIES: hypothetical protein [unclassified Mesorhizobium]RUW33478.1 hypothetical protein EOA38_12900 [Mesorhizobium sp. M1E.F.Ca.ET.041.01.1.1]RUW76765.1 hypothetical protein EOA29_27365 [Mesorhizobium sp. M1E.F.Ca.ET.063.01.1.1]RWD84056.1 MAG: hypothetical protein EOS38_24375 [Mesorhizobium sp.]RWD89690.1 MAG: hypothetical protein EOS39_20500 [Mesorhizobium sp.]TIV51182.1 MAG: hypothetical protein E5V88_17490 [Mesorhizobium sp.]